mmetsp:Transcript_17956/g.47762  ORF Transcript_17956/g.47762 Transcript_17956/m.47762 type:complete len:620 (-) Transcript_17956:338-2197(-)
MGLVRRPVQTRLGSDVLPGPLARPFLGLLHTLKRSGFGTRVELRKNFRLELVRQDLVEFFELYLRLLGQRRECLLESLPCLFVDLLVWIPLQGCESLDRLRKLQELFRAAADIAGALGKCRAVHMLAKSWDLCALDILPGLGIAVHFPNAVEDLVLERRHAKHRELEALLQVLAVDIVAGRATHFNETVDVVLLDPRFGELASFLGAFFQSRGWREPQARDCLGALQHIRLGGDKDEASIGPVHQKLPAKVVVEHILGRLVVDRSIDVAHDPNRISILQVALHHLVSGRIRVVHARGVNEDRARLEHAPFPRLDGNLLHERPKLPACDIVGGVHVAFELAAERAGIVVRDVLDGAAFPGDRPAVLEFLHQVVGHHVQILPPAVPHAPREGRVRVIVPVHGIQLAPALVIVRVRVGDIQDGPAVLLRQIPDQIRELVLPLLPRNKLHLPTVQRRRLRALIVPQLDNRRRTRPHPIRRQQVCLADQRVQQRALPRAGIAHHHNRRPGHLPHLELRQRLEPALPEALRGPRHELAAAHRLPQLARHVLADPHARRLRVQLRLHLLRIELRNRRRRRLPRRGRLLLPGDPLGDTEAAVELLPRVHAAAPRGDAEGELREPGRG